VSVLVAGWINAGYHPHRISRLDVTMIRKMIPTSYDGDMTLKSISPEFVIVGLVVLFWLSIGIHSLTALGGVVRAGIGTALLIGVLGVLLVNLFGVSMYPSGRFALYAAGASLATLAVLTIVMSTLLPFVGVMNPLSVVPLTVAVSALLFCLLFVVYDTDASLNYPRMSLPQTLPVALLCTLPVLAVVASVLMNRFEINTGMFAFVGAVVVVVALAATRFVHTRLYPMLTFSVSVSTLLHHNLLSNHVIGADIQGIYFAAHWLSQVHQWTPTDGSTMALPIVTTVPASYSLLTSIDLTTTFTLVYVLLFALVPLGIFYVSRDVFDADIALFAALFFIFYHISFTFTPGKQLMSELFAVLLVMLVVRGDLHGYGRSAAILLLSVGLVAAHYGTTFLFGFALLFAAIVSFVVDRLVGEVAVRPPVWYPVALLAGASAWYAYASSELFARLASIPLLIFEQVFTLLSGGFIEGSGASYVHQQMTLLSTLNLALYILFTMCIGIGLGWRTLSTLSALRHGEVPDDIGYTVLAIPVFVFLGLSYFLVFNLWADRVYQMALIILAPFMPLGYRYISAAANAVGTRVWSPLTTQRAVGVTTLAVLLGSLLVFNSGLVFALTGPAPNSAFNTDANDLVFSQNEVQGVKWLKTHINPSPLVANHSSTSNHSGAVRIYVDPRSAQLLRSVIPESYYHVKVIRLKSRWRPAVHPDQLNDGYVVIRQASIADAQHANSSAALISKSAVQEITTRGTVVFRNDDIRIVKLGTDMTIDSIKIILEHII
jgi:uncharacterized membrane protein